VVAADWLPEIGASEMRLRMSHEMAEQPEGILTVCRSNFERIDRFAPAEPRRKNPAPVLVVLGKALHRFLF
jgi:hypothetical protein